MGMKPWLRHWMPILPFCEEAPKHVEAFYRLWFESLSPNSPLQPVISGIHERRRADVIQLD